MLQQQIESAKTALSVAEDAVTQLECAIAAALPTSTSLTDAITAAQKELDDFNTQPCYGGRLERARTSKALEQRT
ncbi:hypothetical protein OPT61_g3804 [Boeremia exigua]|uniref:Uncharacterized protein n=1 Tax=Boeremia exigua TaxID=749465 RepID=A0ACC2IGH4_9PLEO|nr:hypothetical protein OPT61_g3804 [Boeremia exigua]